MSKHNKQNREQRRTDNLRGGTFEVLSVDEPGPASPRLADLPGPYAIGWALRAVKDGYVRVRVRIPLDVLEELAIGPASAPDLRSNQAAWIQLEIMQDEALQQIHGGQQR